MIKVEVQSQTLRDLPFKDREGAAVQEQQAWAYFYDRDGNPDMHPRTIAIRMNKGQQPYQSGTYFVHPASLYVGDYGAVKVSPVIRLIPQSEFGKFLNTLVKPLAAAA